MAFTSLDQKKENPVSFKYEVKKLSGNIYEVKIIASIDEPWHIYSQFTPKEGPSLPTHISFVKNPLVEVVGKPVENGKLITKHEEVLDVNLKYFADKVEFVQKIKLKASVKTNLMGTIEYMACTSERCLMPTTEKFTLGLSE
jgi:thiol:disulfide interchange protein DsbD